MCMIDDAEWWTFEPVERIRLARKDHRCEECGRTIETGERYRYLTGLCDGLWSSHKGCLHCVEAARWLSAACSGYLLGVVQEDLGEHVVGDEQYLRTAPLTRLYRWMLADWRDRAGDLRPLEDVKAVADRAIDAYRAQYAKAVAA